MTWILDTRSLIHIYNSLQGLQLTRRFGEGERFLNIGDGRSVSVLTLRIIKLVFDPQYIILLANSNYEISIKKNFCDTILNGVTILRGQLNNGIYIIFRSNVMYISNKCLRIDDIMDAYF